MKTPDEITKKYEKGRYQIPTHIFLIVLIISIGYLGLFRPELYSLGWGLGINIAGWSGAFLLYRYAHKTGYEEGYDIGYNEGSEEGMNTTLKEIGIDSNSVELLDQLDSAKAGVKKQKKKTRKK